MINEFFKLPLSLSADNVNGSFTVQVKNLEIKGEDIGANLEILKDNLQGKFRLMNGNVYRIVNEEPPVTNNVSKLIDLTEKIELNGTGVRS